MLVKAASLAHSLWYFCAADVLIIGSPHHWQIDLTGVKPCPLFNVFRLALFRSSETFLLQSEQYFFVGLTKPSKTPQCSQYLISTLLSRFLPGFPVVPFKALVDGFLKPQHLVCFVSGHARCHRQLQPSLSARRFVKARHQHSPAFLTINVGTSLPVARHRQTHLEIQRFQRAGLTMQIPSFDTPFLTLSQTLIEWRP